MSNKQTSTAALDSFRQGPLRNQRRVPRHPAGASTTIAQRSNASATHEIVAQLL